MMRIQGEYSRHRVWVLVTELRGGLEEHKGGKGAIDLSIKLRLTAALRFINSFKSRHVLAPLNWATRLDAVALELELIENQLANWLDGAIGNAAYSQIELSIEKCLEAFRDWPLEITTKADAKFNEARLLLSQIAQYRDEQIAMAQKTELAAKTLEADLQAAAARWDAETEALTAVRREVKTLTADIAIETKKELIDDAAETKKSYKELFDSALDEASELRDKISALVEESENLASLKAGQVISEGYERYARELDKLRTSWRKIGFMVVGIGIPVLLIFLFNGGSLEVGLQYFLKTSITVTIGALVAYSFREAGQAGKAAEIARYRHLDSVALSTYLRGLKSENSVIAIQEELGKRLASERGPAGQSDARSTAKVATQLIKSLEKLLSRASR